MADELNALAQKYGVERAKRFRPDGLKQYLEMEQNEQWRSLATDPWVDHAALNAQPSNLHDGDNIKVIILGAGFGGLLYAIRLIEAGISAQDIRLVDGAGGFGGTWYWNRYPGLMCDVESYVYLPLLEETGYVPKHKYSYGPEILEYAELMAKKWNLADKGVFRTAVQSFTWEEETKRWVVQMEQSRGPDEAAIKMTVKSQFAIVAGGVLNYPKLPKGLENFKGTVFHTARWNYSVSGGSPTDPNLIGLEDKRVGIIGTGATSIQAIPQLAKCAKELYVFQRTPSWIGVRGQHPTSNEEWKAVASHPGWQRERMENLADWISGSPKSDVDLVNDGWSKMKSYSGLVGGPHEKPITMEEIPNHIGRLMALDVEHSSAVRSRVEAIVKDKATAEALKPWYPCWCKRPTFHDDYLPAFNLPNVHLVDTDGKGVSGSTANALVAKGEEYPIDILILGTGYRAPGAALTEPSIRSNTTITGRGGRTLSEKWLAQGPSTLHGVITNGFPNLFLSGPAQSGQSSNWLHVQTLLSEHVGYIVGEALKSAGAAGRQTLAIEPTIAAEEAWAGRIMQRAMWMAAMGICTPSYVNNEGEVRSQEEMMKMMRGTPYPEGLNAFAEVLKDWREEGRMQGVDVKA